MTSSYIALYKSHNVGFLHLMMFNHWFVARLWLIVNFFFISEKKRAVRFHNYKIFSACVSIITKLIEQQIAICSCHSHAGDTNFVYIMKCLHSILLADMQKIELLHMAMIITF